MFSSMDSEMGREVLATKLKIIQKIKKLFKISNKYLAYLINIGMP
jgi:hypothetical protein